MTKTGIRSFAILIAATCGIVFSGAATAQEKLTVWWVKGFYKSEDAALFAAIKKYEDKTGVKVDLSQYAVQDMIPKTVSALDAGTPPDVAYADVYDFQVAGKWAFRTAQDLAYLLERYAVQERRLSKAALETLSIIAYHQPVTRAEIEEIRGVTTSVGTLDILLETGWVRLRGRRRAPGRPVTYGTTDKFLSHFGLENIKDLPGLSELRASGLLDGNLPPDFSVPEPSDIASLMPDELPLDSTDDDDEAEASADEGDEGDEHQTE